MLRDFAELNSRWTQRVRRLNPRFFLPRFDYIEELRKQVQEFADRPEVEEVLEVGGIDRNLLEKSASYHYTGVDIEERERCHEVYDAFLVQSIEEPLPGRYDLIFSAHLLEHVRDNRKSFKSMYDALNPGGRIMHFIPSKNHFYSIILRIVGPRWQRRILGAIFPPGSLERGGYVTYFDQCSPRAMEKLLVASGFEEIELRYSYTGSGYFRFFTPAYVFVVLCENSFRALGLRAFCAGMLVTATKKPGADRAGRD